MTADRRTFLKNSALSLAAAAAWPTLAEQQVVPVSIDTQRVIGSPPHIWEECAGSDRAAITLRESWRLDLDRWHSEAGLKRVRFHGIFNHELGVFAPSILNRGKAQTPNFENVVRHTATAHGKGGCRSEARGRYRSPEVA
jgi:xylan 1,4-beta-xylosidase